MTDGSSGAPENGAGGPAQEDDPFAYLYRPAEGEGGAERAPVAPRNAYTRPMEVGRAQYGQQPQHQQQPYQQYPQQAQQQQQRQQPYRPQGPGAEQTTQLPQQSRYAERSRPLPGEDTPRGRGKGPVIGVVAVVAAIAIGSGIALSGNDAKDKTAGGHPAAGSGSTHASAPGTPGSSASSSSPSASASPSGSTGSVLDASKAQAQNAPSANTIKGAVSSDGSYLTLQAGSSVSWTVTVPTAGQYKFWLHFNNSGDPVKAAVAVNGTDRSGGVTFKNYGAKGADPTQSWYSTNIWPDLQAGTNTLTVSAPSGGSVLVDQVAITGMDSNSYPTAGAPAPAQS
ncbi:carbohydrate-binding protein [Kitasatospora mediocidica]|uniref:hypothetical protein n=1 Tax=Kitasatospora mediocidica TaxID=58352 RepID=UPI0012F8535F|nr:hypothetical protein [Kitasatospora mediocidica]